MASDIGIPIIYNRYCSKKKKNKEILAFFPPHPQARRKERSHERLGKSKKQLKKGKRKQSATRTKKSILPNLTSCKQIAGFSYQSATKKMYKISERLV